MHEFPRPPRRHLGGAAAVNPEHDSEVSRYGVGIRNRKGTRPKRETVIAGLDLNELTRLGGCRDIACIKHKLIYGRRNCLDGNYGVEACVFYLRTSFIPVAIGIVEYVDIRSLKGDAVLEITVKFRQVQLRNGEFCSY